MLDIGLDVLAAIHLLPHIKEHRCLKNVIHQIEKNEWLHELVFVLPQEKAFYYRFHFKASRKILLKNGTRDY